ncbi:MAG: 5'/3'-nucleotidase SurE [Thermodesulfobacteriota bacterium]
MALILITNDDGIHSPGLTTLCNVLQELGDCVVIAPDRDNSAVSHSLTMSRPLRVTEIAKDHYTLNGTPTDCVAIGLNKILDRRPDLLVSGINPGPNLGDDISYSGTVSAAVEGTMYNIAALAVSLAGDTPHHFKRPAEVACRLGAMILEKGLPEDTLLNVNVPSGPADKGVRITRQGRRLWKNAIQETLDPWGRKHYWIGGGTPRSETARDTDVAAVADGYISVTPIHLDLTNHQGIKHLRDEWDLENSSAD